ncbi:MAG: hypothetical protein FWE49_04360 [Synergistaceae bacterium]|nr:hypothetical protein [Synergistaceae bacterium]
MKYGKFFILFALFTVVLSIFTFVAMHFKSSDDVSLSLFELPENLPYLYCEFNGYPEITGINERFVLFIFWQNAKMNRITATTDNDEWNFRAYTPDAQQVVDRVNQMHTRKARVLPKPGERDLEGRILASDAGLISKFMHTPNIPVHFKAELSKNDNEYIMDFDMLNIESIIPATWMIDLTPIKIKSFPFIKGLNYARLASNITLFELVPQIQVFISKNAKNRNIASALRSMKGELYATISSGSALWDGISIPAILTRFHLKSNAAKQALFDFIYDIFDKKYDLEASSNGYYSHAPLSLWLSQTNEYLETGVIDRRNIDNNGNSDLPEPPEEALMWLSFSPRHLAEAISNIMIQINPDLDYKEALTRFTKIDNCTIILDSVKSGKIRLKPFVNY